MSHFGEVSPKIMRNFDSMMTLVQNPLQMTLQRKAIRAG